MVEVIFNFNGKESIFNTEPEEKLEEIINKFISKLPKNNETLDFIYNGIKLNKNLTFKQQATNNDQKRKKINILVRKKSTTKGEENFIKSKFVICPECKENTRIIIKDYKIHLYECKNGHKIDNILLEDFEKTQNIDKSKLVCNICNCKRLDNANIHDFYKCSTCEINLCPYCKSIHNENHICINYDQKNFICGIHKETFIYYCKNCKKDLCFLCESEHKNCDLILYRKIIKDKIEIEKEIIKLSEKINEFNNTLDNIIKILNEVKKYINNYYNIIYDIFKNYSPKFRNYQILQNINEINNSNHIVLEELDQIIKEKNLNIQFQKIFDIYEKMNYTNEITMKYKIDTNIDSVSIFGRCFVENNKDICKILYEDKEYELKEKFNLNDINIPKDNILKIKLTNINKVTKMNCIFNECKSLISLPDISQWNTSNIKDMKNMFAGCTSLTNLSDISKWNISNVTNLKDLFQGCESLVSLPDISVWDTSNVIIMKGIFSGCSKLSKIPDISKWNTKNVTNMSEMFKECNSLSELPDISKWNMGNVTNINYMFYNCNSLTTLPDISNWETKNFLNMNYIFRGCSSLSLLPDISSWKIDNVTTMNGLFSGCSSLKSLPILSKWNFSKVTSMNSIFENCKNLELTSLLTDVSKWNTNILKVDKIIKQINGKQKNSIIE